MDEFGDLLRRGALCRGFLLEAFGSGVEFEGLQDAGHVGHEG